MADDYSTFDFRRGNRPSDLTGLRFGRRVVTGRAESKRDRRTRWHYICDCGYRGIAYGQGFKLSPMCRSCTQKKAKPARRKRPYEATYNIFKGRAKYPVEITYEQFLELTKQRECHYCGAAVAWQEYRHHGEGGTGSNLDRKDSAGPYSMENVVVCCGRCNYAKNKHFTYEEWKALGDVIRGWRALALLQEELEAGRTIVR